MYKQLGEVIEKKSIKTIMTDKIMSGLKIDARNERIVEVLKTNLGTTFNSISGTDIGKVLAGDMKPINDKLQDILTPVKAQVTAEYKGIALATVAGIFVAGGVAGLILGAFMWYHK
jgi:hypothetical protein